MEKLVLDIIVLEMEGMLGVVPRGRGADSEGLSSSMADEFAVLSLLLCLRCLFDGAVAGRDMEEAPGPGAVFSGAAAIGTTPLPPTMAAPPYWLPGVLPAVKFPLLVGLSASLLLLGRFIDGGDTAAWLLTTGTATAAAAAAAADMDSVEFFLEAALEPVPAFFLVPPTGRLLPDPRFLFLMTSVFKLSGRTTPWSFRKRPQALHRGWPSGLRLHSGVV